MAKATYVVLSGLTDANGRITGSRVFSSDQPVYGRVRKSSTAPFFQTTDLVGTIDNETGLDIVAEVLPDE